MQWKVNCRMYIKENKDLRGKKNVEKYRGLVKQENKLLLSPRIDLENIQ